MSIDLNAIATALALRYDPLNLAPPGGEQAIRTSTAKPPNAITDTPYVVVMAATDADATFDGGGGTRVGLIPFSVEFYLEKAADLPRQMTRLQRWAPVLLDATLASVHLGLAPPVAFAWAKSFRIGDITYAGQAFAAIRLLVEVHTSDGISPVA
jgi:hypothetical protein